MMEGIFVVIDIDTKGIFVFIAVACDISQESVVLRKWSMVKRFKLRKNYSGED